MGRVLTGLLVLLFVAASVSQAVPDPWRVRATDLDPMAPTRVITGLCDNEPQPFAILGVEGAWGTAGGRFHTWYRNGPSATASVQYAINSFNATTGAISWGTDNVVSIEGVGTGGSWGEQHTINVLKVGSVYRLYNFRATWQFPSDTWYSTSTDAVNFSAPTMLTIAGSTDVNTGCYAFSVYRSTGGVYLSHHKNSHAYYGYWMAAIGLATSGDGDTVWYDIDTNNTPGAGNSAGDPLMGPDPALSPTTPDGYSSGRGDFARACDGNLMLVYSFQNSPSAPWKLQTPAVTVGTAGELAGGDHYVFLCDPDSDTTISGIANTPFGIDTIPGLSGPTQRTTPVDWGNNAYHPLGLKGNKTDPATKFFVLYQAWYDTNSDGTRDTEGFGRGILLMTRNKADLNYDGTVSFSDVSLFSGSFGASSGQPGYNPDADLNNDGKVDFLDAAQLSGRYGSDCSYGQ